jgi:small-conductance mechanosensitive channel
MRLIYAFVFLVFSACAVLAQTASAPILDMEKFTATANRAVAVIEAGAASNAALDDLRSQLAQFRSAALQEQARHADRIATIQARIDALGPPPEDGQSESEEVANLRAELQTTLNTAKAPALSAEEAYRRADGLIREIDLLVRARNTSELLRLGPSPLNPLYWSDALKAVTNYTSLVAKETLSNWTTESRKVERINNLPAVAGMFALGILLLFRARRWARVILGFVSRKASLRLSAVYSFGASLAQLVMPIIGLGLLQTAIEWLGILDVRGQFLLEALMFGAFALFFASWLARSLLQPNGRQVGLITTSAENRKGLRRVIMSLALVFAFNEILNAMNSGNDLPEHVVAVLRFPLMVLGGLALIRMGAAFGKTAREVAQDTEVVPFTVRVAGLIGRVSMAAGFLGPVLAGIGYGQAGSRLIFASLLSLALIATLYIFYRLLGMLSAPLASVPASGSLADQHRSGALLQVGLGFVFVLISVPFLALIWGARVSDLYEVWLYLREGISIGDTRISITDFLTFVLIFSLGYTVTRLLQSALRSTVLPNTKLDAGGQNAIVTGTGYVGIFLAALAAISATGLDLSNLAIVAGALSVGIGFGLQAIVSNFVSGIILLIERPINEGDWIDVGGHSGTVQKISVRSTTIQTFDRATLIIPNADLISGTVTNWTHKSLTGRVKVPVGVSYDSDPRQVEAILRDIAESHPMVLRNPAPSVVFIGFGADSLDFEIRAILRDINWMLSARSDMNFEIMRRFSEAGIEIPFAQRDIKLKNMDELAEVLKGMHPKEA